MYDLLKYYLKTDSTSRILQKLLNVKDFISHRTGEVYLSGSFKNLNVMIYDEHRFSVTGSIAKYHFGTNLETLSRGDVPFAFKKLSKELNCDLSVAKVTRMEVGANLCLKHHVNEYMDLLGECSRYTRLEDGTRKSLTVIYNQKMKSLRFYNKLSEMLAKDAHNIPLWCDDQNILRYEIRLNRPDKDLKNKRITVSTLWDESFFKNVLQFWQDKYSQIIKKKILILPDDISFQKPSDFDRYCKAYTMQDDVMRKAIEMRVEYYTKEHTKSRIKTKMRDSQTSMKFLVESDRIKELDEQIREIVLRYQ